MVESYANYWISQISEAIPFNVDPDASTLGTTTDMPTIETTEIVGGGVPLKEMGAADILVRLHGESASLSNCHAKK